MIKSKRSRRAGRWGLAGFAIAMFAATASAQTPQAAVGVEITPARIQKDLTDRAISEHVVVINHETDPRRIALSVTSLGHDLDGAPEYFDQSDPPLSADATEFVLGPGERREVLVSGNIPSNAHSLYAALVAEFAPLVQQGGQIEVHSRVASLLLFRGPKPWDERVEITDIQVIPGQGGPARVTAAIKNIGDVHVKPTGTAKIVKDGTVLATVPLTGQLIIPGFARRLSGTWNPPKKLAGTIKLTVNTTRPKATFTRDLNLGGSIESRPQGEITNLRGSEAKGGRVSLTVRNTGGVPFTPAVTLFARSDGVERARVVLPQKEMAPGSSVDVAWDPALADGVYLVTAQLKRDQDLLDEDTTDLRVGAAANARSDKKTAGRSPAIVVALLLLLLVLAGFVEQQRRRRKSKRGPGGGTPVAHVQSPEPAGVR